MFSPIGIREQLSKTAWHLALVAGGAVVSAVLFGGNSQVSDPDIDSPAATAQQVIDTPSAVTIGPRHQIYQTEGSQEVGPTAEDYIGPGVLVVLAAGSVAFAGEWYRKKGQLAQFSRQSVAEASIRDGFTGEFSEYERAVLNRLDKTL